MKCNLCNLVVTRRDKMASHLRSRDFHGLRIRSKRGRPLVMRSGMGQGEGASVFVDRRSRSPHRSPSRRPRTTPRRRRDSSESFGTSESDYSVSPRRAAVLRDSVTDVGSGAVTGSRVPFVVTPWAAMRPVLPVRRWVW